MANVVTAATLAEFVLPGRPGAFMRKLVAIIILTAGCQAATSPPLTGDLYVLESIEGVTLPAPYAPNRYAVVADTLAFAPDGTGTRRTTDSGQQDPSRPTREESPFDYVRSADRITVYFSCTPGVACIQAPYISGSISATGITFTTSLISRAPLTYHRLMPAE